MTRFAARGSDSGASVVEFALVLPILMYLVFGLFDLLLYQYTQNELHAGARDGARVAILHPTDTAAITAAIRQRQGTSLSTQTVTVSCQKISDLSAVACASANPGDLIKVAVVTTYKSLIPPLPGIPGVVSIAVDATDTLVGEPS